MGESTHSLGNRAVSGSATIWPRLTETANPDHRESPVDFRQLSGPQTPLLHRAGPEVLDQHVVVRNKSAKDTLSFRTRDVECNDPFVALDNLPPDGLPVLLG